MATISIFKLSLLEDFHDFVHSFQLILFYYLAEAVDARVINWQIFL